MNADANELIRAAFERAAAADPAADGSGVADAVRSAASRADQAQKRAEKQAEKQEREEAKSKDKEPREPRDRGRLVMALGGIGLALALVGGVLAVSLGGSSGPESITTANQTVHMYRCPGSEPVGTLRRGDVVRSLARSRDSKWLAVTFPTDVAEQVWVPAKEVSSDTPTSKLPIARCTAKNAVEIAGKKPPTTDATPTTASKPRSSSGATTTTARAATTSTTTLRAVPNNVPSKNKGSNPVSTPAPTKPNPQSGPKPTGPPTSAPPPPPPPTTTVPPDTTPPEIASVVSTPKNIYSNNGICGASTPKTSTIAAEVSDDRGVKSVTMAWRWNGVLFADQNGATSRSMTLSGSDYVAEFGKFGDVQKYGITLVLTITATDLSGNVAKKTLNIAVFSCHM
jgi:hypothetical protein